MNFYLAPYLNFQMHDNCCLCKPLLVGLNLYPSNFIPLPPENFRIQMICVNLHFLESIFSVKFLPLNFCSRFELLEFDDKNIIRCLVLKNNKFQLLRNHYKKLARLKFDVPNTHLQQTRQSNENILLLQTNQTLEKQNQHYYNQRYIELAEIYTKLRNFCPK